MFFGLVGVGTNSSRLVEDFRYMFEDILKLGETAVFDVERRSLMGKYEAYICCTYERDDAKNKLELSGFEYGKDYFFAEDFFGLLDDWKGQRIAYKSYQGNIKGWLKSIIFGYAAVHGKVLPEDAHYAVLKGNYGSIEGKRSRNLFVYALYFGLGSLEALPQIVAKGNGYRDYDHICFFSAADAVKYKKDFPSAADKVTTVEELKNHTMASLYMRAVYYDRRQNDCGCDLPYNTIWIGKDGMSRLCECPDFLMVGCGNMGLHGAADVWESRLAKIVRLSVINNSYTFCSRQLCGRLAAGKEQEKLLDRRKKEEPGYPSKVCFAGDSVCNLHCPSCRKKAYFKNDEKTGEGIQACINSIVGAGWLDKAEHIIVGGSGESFFSQNYKRVIYEVGTKRKNIVIMTNGTLFTPKEWEKLEGRYEHISFWVSVDAATRETYEKVRCGGNFSRLMDNMDFLSNLLRSGKVDSVSVIMVVQKANYTEIPDFIRWAKVKGFDGVSLSHIRNWGTYGDTDFYNNVSMFDRNGKMKPELAAVLENPVCRDPIVEMRWAE